MRISEFTLIVPFYRNCRMLERQAEVWKHYPDGVRVLVVDDGSPEAARPILEAVGARCELYRIEVDIPWNRGGARNLGTQQAGTDWIVHVDIDHVMPVSTAEELLRHEFDPAHWYRFERFRNGRADETRRKDKIPPGQAFGKIHPHIDSYLCTRGLYWKAGGYNEDFSGCLGGGSPFLAELEQVAGPPLLAPSPAHLVVHTRDSVPDASDHSLSRDRTEYSRRKAALRGRLRGSNPIRFTWSRQELCTRA